jgi:hypothetical protein
MHLLLKSGIFPTRDFESWDAVPNKTWPVFKTFFHGAYVRKLVALNIRNTAGQQEYVPQNMYHVLDGGNNTSNTDTTLTQTTAAGTTGSTLDNTYQATAIPPDLTAAINTITVNQQSLYQHIAPLSQQMAALSFHVQPLVQARQPALHPPPVQHQAIPGPLAYGEIMEGTSRSTSKAGVVVATPSVAVMDATTTGVVVAAPHLRIKWPLKVVDMVEAPMPFPLQVAALSDLSSQIWLNNITIGMCVICVVLM